MEIKTHALLLSLLVITGAVTIDAYAQTNSQRIATIDDNTDAIKTVVDAINDMVSGMSDAIGAISSSIAGLESTMLSVDASVKEVNDSVTSMSTDITTIKSSITGFGDVMLSISVLSEKISGVEDRLTSIESSIVNQGSDVAVQSLSDQVSRMVQQIDAVNAQLAAISEELGVIKTSTTTTSTPSPTGYFEGKTTKSITNYDYKQHGKKFTVNNKDYYDLDMTFTCTADVFLDTADMTESQGASTQYLSRLPDSPTHESITPLKDLKEVNSITVDGRTLYSSSFNIAGSNYVELDVRETFDNRRLVASNGLKFETRIYDGDFINTTGDNNIMVGLLITPTEGFATFHHAGGSGLNTLTETVANHTLIAGAMKNPRNGDATEIELYTVEVTWNTFNAATCSIGIGGSTAIGADTPYSLTFSAEVSGTGLLKEYEKILDCGGNPLEITTITAASSDSGNLANFGNLELTLLDGNNDGTADVVFEFDSDWALSEHDDSPRILPLTVSGHDVQISGNFPGDGLILQINYNSVPNANCQIR